MNEITISQCLRRVSKLKGDLKELLARAAAGVSHTEDAPPAFGFAESLEQAEKVREELIALETALRITNAVTKIKHNGRELTLAEATVLLQESKGRVAWYKGLRVLAQARVTTATTDYDDEGKRIKTQVVTVCALPEAERARQVRDEQEAFDRLNDVVENTNHRTTLRG